MSLKGRDKRLIERRALFLKHPCGILIQVFSLRYITTVIKFYCQNQLRMLNFHPTSRDFLGFVFDKTFDKMSKIQRQGWANLRSLGGVN